jgi:hypothetical protein
VNRRKVVSGEQEKAKAAVRGSESVVEGLPHSIGRKHGGPPSIYTYVPTRAIWDAKFVSKKHGGKRGATGLTEKQLHILLAVCAYANNQGFAWPALKTIAETVNTSYRQVQAAMIRAAELGYVEKVSAHKSHPKWKHIYSTVYRIIYDHRLDTDDLIDAMNTEDPPPVDEQSIPMQSEAVGDDKVEGELNHGDERGEEQLVEASGVARWFAAEAGRITGELRLVNPRSIDAAARAIEAIGVDRVKADAHDALIICRDIRKPAPLNLLFLAER